VASAVPDGGLTDVHRYLVMTLAGREVTIDVTFPADQPWDGRRSMRLACGDGRDFPAGLAGSGVASNSRPWNVSRVS
jgi:hypothetical protein